MLGRSYHSVGGKAVQDFVVPKTPDLAEKDLPGSGVKSRGAES